MNMVLHAVEENRFAAHVLQHARHVGVHPRANLGLAEKGNAVLRAEHDMQDDAGMGLGRGVMVAGREGIFNRRNQRGRATSSVSVEGQRPVHKPAQGNALGNRFAKNAKPQRGGTNHGVPPRARVTFVVRHGSDWAALSGLEGVWTRKPRALPWAGLWTGLWP